MDAIREMLAERVVELEGELRSHKAAMEGMQDERDALTARLEDSQDWEEVALRFQAERNALAAHVERLINAGCDMQDDYQMGDDSPHHAGIDAWADALKDTPTTSLARLKAQWQAGALEKLYSESQGSMIINRGSLLDEARELRRQAEEPTPNGSD